MANIVPVILAGISLVIGLILLIASSLWIAEMQKELKDADVKPNCDDPFLAAIPQIDGLCKSVAGSRAAGALGIIAGLLQLVFCVVILVFHFTGKSGSSKKLVMLVTHGIIFVTSVIAFGLGMYYYPKVKDFVEYAVEQGGSASKDELQKQADDTTMKYKFLNGASGLDWIFCLIFMIASVFLVKEK